MIPNKLRVNGAEQPPYDEHEEKKKNVTNKKNGFCRKKSVVAIFLTL